MRTIFTFFMVAFLSLIATQSNAQLNPQERKPAIESLKETEAGVFDAVKGLSEAQLTFKSAADKWSVEDCVKHIAASEHNLWEMAAASLKQPANPEKRADIKVSDEQLVAGAKDRSYKRKTFAALEPANSNYKTLEEALASFKENRDKLITYIESTNDDLRNHVLVLPMGTFDAYQFILLISAHSDRHTQQIAEVKADPNFPKR